MGARTIVLTTAAALCAAPAAAHEWAGKGQAKPREITAFSVADRTIEMRAVTWRARADTMLGRAHYEESRNMRKVYPGYPQPAYVTLDFRVRF